MGFEDLTELSKKFRFLVGSCPGWEATFSDANGLQCYCPVFWTSACEHALLVGLYLAIDDGGIGSVPPQYLHVPLLH